MKKLILLLVTVVLTITCYSQTYLGYSLKQVKDTMYKDPTFVLTASRSNSVCYTSTSGYLQEYFNFNNDSCFSFMTWVRCVDCTNRYNLLYNSFKSNYTQLNKTDFIDSPEKCIIQLELEKGDSLMIMKLNVMTIKSYYHSPYSD